MFARLGDALTLAIEDAWTRPPMLLWLLAPLEWLFGALTALRRLAFRRGWLRAIHPGVPVVVVGNILVGGTGKTPAVIAIARALESRGYHVGVVSRGYGGSASTVQRVGASSSAADVGDEALLIARSTAATVVVGRDRVAACRALVDAGVQLILSDDGLQHYRLDRDVEVVTLDAAIGVGNGHLLPLGPLREPRRRLASVDFMLERNGSNPATSVAYQPLQLRRLAVAADAPDARRSLTAPGFGPRVHALAAIARPGRFFLTLRELGFDPLEHPLPDHRPIPDGLLDALADLPIIMTAKDAVKCDPGPRASTHNNAWILDMGLELPPTFIDALLARIARRRVSLPSTAAQPGGRTL